MIWYKDCGVRGVPIVKKKGKFKITQEDFLKMNRKARRDIELEQGIRQSPKIHNTHKKDKNEGNTIREWEDD